MELKEVKWGFCNLHLFLYKSERSTSRKIFLFKSERSTSSKNKTQQALSKRKHQTYCTDKINPKLYARKQWSYNPPCVPLQWKWATQRLNALRIFFFFCKQDSTPYKIPLLSSSTVPREPLCLQYSRTQACSVSMIKHLTNTIVVIRSTRPVFVRSFAFYVSL